MNKYIIIPNCSDLNRGDQALVWETKRIAEDAGYIGDYFVTVEDNEPIEQSKKHGLKPMSMILKHPSRFFKKNDNIVYGFSLKLKWGGVAMFDMIMSALLLLKPVQFIIFPFLSDEKRQTIRIFKESDALFVKGGGFMHYYGGLTSLYYAYFSLYHIFFAAKYNKKIFILPNSIGPFEGPFIKWIMKKAFSKCNLVTVRETYSQEMIKKELNLNVQCYPDLAMFLPNSSLSKEEIFIRYNIPRDRKIVAITMRPHRFTKSATPKDDYMRFKEQMANFIEWLYLNGYLPMLIDHTLAINTNENDAICIEEVLQMVSEDHYFYFSDKKLNCEELKSVYSICDYIVGTRFHSVIFSFANNIPGIAIRYTGNKAQGIMNDIGLLDLSIDIGAVMSNKLQENFQKVVENESTIKDKISSYMKYAQSARSELILKMKEV